MRLTKGQRRPRHRERDVGGFERRGATVPTRRPGRTWFKATPSPPRTARPKAARRTA